MHVPSQKDQWRNYRRTEESVLRWHEGFSILQSKIAHGTGIIEALKGDEMTLAPTSSPADTSGHVPAGSDSDTVKDSGRSSAPPVEPQKHPKRAKDSASRRGDAVDEKDSFDAELRRRKAKWAGQAHDTRGPIEPSTRETAVAADEMMFHSERLRDSRASRPGADAAVSGYAHIDGKLPPQGPSSPSMAHSLFGLSVKDNSVDETWLFAFLSVFLVLLAAAYVTQSPPVAAVAFVLNCMFLLLLYRAKVLNDAVSGCVEALRLAQVRLAGVFASYSSTEMVAQSLCLRKVDIIAAFWESHMYGVRLPVPILGQVAVDTNLLLSVTIPNMLGLLQLMLALVQGDARASKKPRAAQSVLQQLIGALGWEPDPPLGRSSPVELSHSPAVRSFGLGSGGGAEIVKHGGQGEEQGKQRSPKQAEGSSSFAPLACGSVSAGSGTATSGDSEASAEGEGVGGFTATMAF